MIVWIMTKQSEKAHRFALGPSALSRAKKRIRMQTRHPILAFSLFIIFVSNRNRQTRMQQEKAAEK